MENQPKIEEPQLKTPIPNNINVPRKKLIWLGVLVFLILLIVTVTLLFFKNDDSSSGRITNLTKDISDNAPLITPEITAFSEMTIPSLRKRTYNSSLGELVTVSSNGSYTSYLTNYTSDGIRINALLTKPTGEIPEGGWPAIVFVHGYIPPTIYTTNGAAYSAYVDYLARNGFVVFKIDLRGHGDSEGEPGGGYYGADYVTDALNAYAAMQSIEFVDPNSIGMWGHSMAGNVLLRSMAAKQDIPAIVIWAGAVYSYTDQLKYGINDNSYRPPMPSDPQRINRRRELYEKYGSPSAQSVFWSQVAATSYLSDIKGAIQLHHAVDDDVVNVGYSRDLVELLDNTSVQHELYEYSSGGHNITGFSFNQAMQRTVEFYKENL